MQIRRRSWAAGVIGLSAALALAACGSSSGSKATTGSSSASATTAAKSGGTLKVVEGTAPDSLDPQFEYTTQGNEADSMVYTPMVQYAFKEGTAGTQLIPGLATALPTVSADKLTYSMTMRPGLKFSDGTPVVASDFKYAIERAIKIAWGGDSFFIQYISGADAYSKGKATDISGITADDATGAITVKLTTPYGAFDNLLAFGQASPIPATTPMKVLSNTPPIGIGPYKFGKIVPNASYTLLKNPTFASFNIPNYPAGYVDEVDVTVDSNTTTEAQSVLTNQADIFDPGDTIPASVLPLLPSQANGRYTKEPLASVYYFFMNTKTAPFDNESVRTAVNMALDRTALARLSSGSLTPGCYFLPPTIIGHQDGACPFGDPSVVPSAATVAKAKAMIAAAGDAGKAVTVWSETRSPRQEYCAYLNDLLNQLGFKSTLKVIQDAAYFPTIGNESLEPQIGFADWSQDFPNPSDFYLLVSKAGIQPTSAQNFGQIDDPKIEGPLATLSQVPASDLASSESGWKALDAYVISQSYLAPYGYETAPKFTSNRVDYATSIFNPVLYFEFNTVSLK